MDLLIVINEKDDLIYKQKFTETEMDEKLYYDLLIISYGSIDILNIMMKNSSSPFYSCIDTYKEYKISVLIFPSGYKCFFIHRQNKNLKKFMNEVYIVFKNLIINEIMNYDEEIHGIEDIVDNVYNKYYKK